MSDNVNYQLPPTEITDWVKWRMLWNLAMRMNLLSDVSFGPPTTPEEYQQLVSYINSLLNTGSGGNILPAIKQGSTVLPAVSQNAQYALMAINPTDPANVGTISAQPIEGIVTGGGSIGTVIATVSGGSYGAVKRSVAALAAVSIFGTSILAFQMAQEKIDDLITSLDPFVDENDNIITYTDENGNTYLPHDVLEAVRQKLIEMGVYNLEPQPSVMPETGTNIYYRSGGSGSFTTQPLEYSVYNTVKPYMFELTSYLYKRNASDTNTYLIDRFYFKTQSSGWQTLPLKAYGYFCRANSRRHDFYGFVDKDYFPSDIVTTEMIRVTDANRNVYPTGFYPSQYSEYKSTIDGVVYTKYGFGFSPQMDDYYFNLNDFPSLDSSTGSFYYSIYASLNPIPGGGIEGVEIQEDATVPSDPNQTLADYFPTWTGQGKVFNTIKKGVDGTIESIGETTFLPVTLKDTQPVIEGTTMNQTEAQEGTAQDNPDITNELLPAIQELLEKIINSPDIPTPTIPAGDSGDTPPAEPPLISGSANGLWAIYNPTLQQVQDFGAYLWSENILDQITRMFNSPIDAVIGFHMIYCTPIKGAAKNIKCGYLDTGVSSITVANQYATIDCGTVTVPEYYGTVLDYTATKLALYLPFIGIVPLSTAICMSSTLHIIYRIDVLTGTCLAQVKVIKENSEAVMYTFEGNCSVQIPLTATTYTGIASALINTVSAGLSVFMGDYISAAGDVGNALGAGMTNLSGTKQSGSLGANAGALGIRIPYLIITHPVSYDALQYNTQYGYPLNQTISLGSVTGYTRVKDIHLAGIPCTDDELEIIERLLKDGVIIN